MSDSHEPSYYEIALTNRQVIVAFVILLVCLIAAFFSGVWVGRESGFRAAEQMAGNTPPAVEEEKEGRNLEELENDGLILAEHLAACDTEKQAVADLSRGSGDRDARGSFHLENS